jgi:hypothetical protein
MLKYRDNINPMNTHANLLLKMLLDCLKVVFSCFGDFLKYLIVISLNWLNVTFQTILKTLNFAGCPIQYNHKHRKHL